MSTVSMSPYTCPVCQITEPQVQHPCLIDGCRTEPSTPSPTPVERTPPHYYLGNDGLEAKRVVNSFELGPWTAQSVCYLLRAGKKTPCPKEDLIKARNMIDEELDRLKGIEEREAHND